jgi:hypothetical protein
MQPLVNLLTGGVGHGGSADGVELDKLINSKVSLLLKKPFRGPDELRRERARRWL